MAVDPKERPSAADALNSRCFTEFDLEMLRNQLGLLLSVEFHSAAITVILESEPGVLVAILHSFGGITIQALHRKATDLGFLEVVWLLGGTALEAYFEGDLSSLPLPTWYGQIDMIEVMRDCIAPGRVRGGISRRRRALRKAAEDGYLDVVKLLIAQGADVNATSKWSEGLTALQDAAHNGHVDVVKLLIATGADVNATSRFHGSATALQAAAEHGQVDAIHVLLSHGANVDAMCRGQAALHIAAKKGQVNTIRVLLAHGADVNANCHGWTALHDAAEKGHVDVIKVLLAHGADFDEEDKGWPALKTAVVYGQIDAIRVLLAHGAEVGGQDSGGTTLHETAGSEYDPAKVNFPQVQTFGVLIMPVYSMRVVHRGHKRWTPLQLAITNRHRDAITVLLAHGLGMVSHTVVTANIAREQNKSPHLCSMGIGL